MMNDVKTVTEYAQILANKFNKSDLGQMVTLQVITCDAKAMRFEATIKPYDTWPYIKEELWKRIERTLPPRRNEQTMRRVNATWNKQRCGIKLGWLDIKKDGERMLPKFLDILANMAQEALNSGAFWNVKYEDYDEIKLEWE